MTTAINVSIIDTMKLIAQVKLTPSAEQHTALVETLKRANAACDAISEAACEAASEAAWAARAACEAVSEVARAAWATCNDWAACENAMKKWQNRHLLNLIRKEGK